jgi:PD-(D/E)XK endonuclease
VSHPKEVGDRTVLAVMLALQGAGYAISAPFGENTRYDLVIDDGLRLARVQCKTGRLRRGAVRFSTCSSYGHHRRPPLPRRSYKGEVDFFAVHCVETGHVYLVPLEEVFTQVEGALRIDAPRNGQRRRVRYAAPFEVAHVVVTPSS